MALVVVFLTVYFDGRQMKIDESIVAILVVFEMWSMSMLATPTDHNSEESVKICVETNFPLAISDQVIQAAFDYCLCVRV